MYQKLIYYLALGITVFTMTSFGVEGNPFKGSQKEVSLERIHSAIKEVYGENYKPDSPIEQVMLEERYGIKKGWCEELIAEQDLMRIGVDIFIAVKAKEGEAAHVVEALETYKKEMIENSFVYPMNIGKVNAAEIRRYGDYVFYFILGGNLGTSGETEETEKAALIKAKEANQPAIDLLNLAFNPFEE